MEDYYNILGVNQDASDYEIKKAFRSLIKIWHPDVCTEPNAHEKSVKIIEAHRILTNPQTRREYDYLLNHARRSSSTTSSSSASSSTSYSEFSESFARAQQAAREQARQYVNKTLDDLLNMLVETGKYVWQGDKRFAQEGFSFGARLRVGFKGFFFVLALVLTFTGVMAPITVPIGIMLYLSLRHDGKFVGFGKLIGSTFMVIVLLIVVWFIFLAILFA